MNNQEDLIGKLLEASNQISKHSRRGPGNYMICGTAVGNHMKEKIITMNGHTKIRHALSFY